MLFSAAECGSLLMIIAEEISVPLQSLAEVTWTAKELHAIISGEDPQLVRKKIHPLSSKFHNFSGFRIPYSHTRQKLSVVSSNILVSTQLLIVEHRSKNTCQRVRYSDCCHQNLEGAGRASYRENLKASQCHFKQSSYQKPKTFLSYECLA